MENNNKNIPANEGAKKPLNSNLIAIIIAAVAVVVLIALLVPTLITLNNKNADIENFNTQLEDLKGQIAGIDTSDGITAEELEAALNGLDIPEGGLTEEQVKAIVKAALEGLDGLTEEEVGALITEALKGINTGLTEDQVQNIIDNAIAGIEIPEAGLTAEEIKAIVDEAIAGIELPDAGLTEEQIKDIINEAIAGIEMPEAGLTAEEVKAIVDGAIAGIDKGLTEEQIKEIVDTAIAGIDKGLTAEEVKAIVDGAIAGIDKGLTAEEVKAIVDEAIAGIDKGLTAEEIKAIIDEAIAGIVFPEAGLSKAEVEALIAAAIANADKGLTEEEVLALITEALKGIDTGLTEDEIREIIKEMLGNQLEDLKSTLENGGAYSLTGNVTLDELNVSEGVISNLNLNGYTLTLSGTWEIAGTLGISNGKVVINVPEKEEDLYMKAGLNAVAGGTLALNNVEIEGNRVWNVRNEGELTLTNSEITVNGGYGVSNSRTDTASTTIKNSTFVSNGEAASPIYSLGGTMDIISTRFSEGLNFVDYYYVSPIESHYTSKITLEDVTVETSEAHVAFAATGGTIVIKSGSFNNKLICVGDDTSVSLYGGTINGVAFKDITAESAIFDGARFGLSYDSDAKCWVISY